MASWKTPDVYHVYIIAHEGHDGAVAAPCKIGVARYPGARMKELQTGNPQQLVLFAQFAVPKRGLAFDMERLFHVSQCDRQLVGEWFSIEPIAAAECMCDLFRACLQLHIGDDHLEDHALDACGVFAIEKRMRRSGRGEAMQ